MQEVINLSVIATLQIEQECTTLRYSVQPEGGSSIVAIELECGDVKERSEVVLECARQQAFEIVLRLAAGTVFPMSLQEIMQDFACVRQ